MALVECNFELGYYIQLQGDFIDLLEVRSISRGSEPDDEQVTDIFLEIFEESINCFLPFIIRAIIYTIGDYYQNHFAFRIQLGYNLLHLPVERLK